MREPKINLGEYPELSASLRGEARPETLYASCQRLLGNCGVESAIDMLPAVVTKWHFETQLEGQPLYARVGRLQAKRGEEQLPVIVFDETSTLPVQTGNFLALGFQRFGDKVSLLTQNSMNPLIDDPRYLALARDIVRGIAAKDAEAREAARAEWTKRLEAVRALGGRIRDYFRENKYDSQTGKVVNIGKERRINWGLGAAAFSLAYGHLLGGDIDAHIGPLPMPQPIEGFVDLANQKEHAAQGFKEPKGTVSLAIGDKDTRLPVIDTYDTRGVPDATHTTTYGVSPNYRYEYKEVSEPGLYKVNYTVRPPLSGGEGEPPQPHCFTVYGNYRSGKSSAFTQDTEAAASVRLEVKNTDEMEACVAPSGGGEVKGSFYIWQDK